MMCYIDRNHALAKLQKVGCTILWPTEFRSVTILQTVPMGNRSWGAVDFCRGEDVLVLMPK